MIEFEIGDRVRRVALITGGMKVGHEGTVMHTRKGEGDGADQYVMLDNSPNHWWLSSGFEKVASLSWDDLEVGGRARIRVNETGEEFEGEILPDSTTYPEHNGPRILGVSVLLFKTFPDRWTLLEVTAPEPKLPTAFGSLIRYEDDGSYWILNARDHWYSDHGHDHFSPFMRPGWTLVRDGIE